jgi:hypothetical protein
MSTSADFQDQLRTRLMTPGVLRVAAPVLKRKTKGSIAQRTADLAADIESAANNHGLCLWVLPPLPMRAEGDVDSVFISHWDTRIRIAEVPSLNSLEADLFDLIEDVMVGLHYQEFDGHSDYLKLADTPTEMIAESTRERVYDVIFRAAYGLLPTVSTGPSLLTTEDGSVLTTEDGTRLTTEN